jgi:hypothetical protein
MGVIMRENVEIKKKSTYKRTKNFWGFIQMRLMKWDEKKSTNGLGDPK